MCMLTIKSIFYLIALNFLDILRLSCTSLSLSAKLSVSRSVMGVSLDDVCFMLLRLIPLIRFLLAELLVVQSGGLVECTSGVRFKQSETFKE